jgi:hypothetical protein
MSIYITQIGKHRFICGLFWQSLSRPRELFKEAAELAKKIDSDLMVVRKDHATAQAGFAHTRDGARRMAYSLGAVVSKTLELEGVNYDGHKQTAHNWLGAFKLPDGQWAYFAVRDASFLPNGDFAGTKEEVLDRLHGDYGLGGWNVVIGDAELEEYGFHNFNVKRIEDLIPHGKNGQIKVHKWWGLRPVEPKISWPFVAAVGSLSIMLAVGGYVYWQRYQLKKEEQQRELAIEAARQKMLGKAAPAALPHPWPSTPLPLLTANACLENLTYLTVGGWFLDDYTCTTSGVSYTWSRHDSTVNFLLDQVPGANIHLTGNRATLAVPLRLPSGSDEMLLDPKGILEPLISRLQLLNISPQITPASAQSPQRTLPGAAPQEVPKADWQQFSFAINTGSMPPTEIATILSQPGIRLNKLSYRSGAWSIEGVIYAKLP